MRLLFLTVPLLVLPLALAATDGPDDGDMVYTDSDEAQGPSYAWLDATGGDAWVLDDDEFVAVDLPFGFEFYGTTWQEASISANGVLFFEGASPLATGICPDTSTVWTGIAAYWDDLAASTVYTRTYGTYPWRTFVVSWENVAHATAGGSASFQIWLLEGRNEAVVVLDDTTFGDPTYDDGATAVIGTNGPSGGLAYGCNTTISPTTAIWFGDQGARPDRVNVYTDDIDAPWTGRTDFDYAGRALATGDVNGDGTDELLVGTQDRSAGEVALIYRPDAPGDLGDADAILTGSASSDAFGTALLLADFDGDGAAEVFVGAPGNDDAGNRAGQTYLWAGGSLGGALGTTTADASWTGPGTGNPASGSVLASGDFDGDGYIDLVVSAPTADTSGTDAGVVYASFGSAVLPSGSTALATGVSFTGANPSDQLGGALAAGDLDGDGDDELVLSALFADDGATNAGTVYIVDGGGWAGANDIDTYASCAFSTPGPSARLGASLLLADIDGSGALDLFVGASTEDNSYSDGGNAYGFYEIGIATCPGTALASDTMISGVANSANLGSTLTAGDLDGDGVDDLVVAAPNMGLAASGGGAAYVYTTAPLGDLDADTADHVFAGSGSAAALGTALAVAATVDDLPALVATAPYDSVAYSSEGAVYAWTWRPNFADADADGYVSTLSGGNDCDDTDATASPEGTDTPGDSVDGDCDGWVDGVVRVRSVATEWAWDLSELGGAETDLYDFETYADGATITTYGDVTFAGTVYADATVYGSSPVDSIGARLLPGSTNTLGIDFGDPIDAVSLRLLDPDDTFTLVATGASGTVVSGYVFPVSANDRAGGALRAFTFVDEVTAITLTGATTDGFGIDQLEIAWASSSDRDGDGWTDADGDCDDADIAVNPDATEDITNGIDDDCDGVIDAGSATAYSDASAWEAAAALDLTTVIDFEVVSGGEVISSQYLSEGVAFDSGMVGAAVVDGTPAHDGIAARVTASSTTIVFDEEQPAISFYVLDGDVSFSIDAYDNHVLLYSTTFTPSSADAFYGLVFDLPVDEIIMSGVDTWALDDLAFSTVGLDDADGDGQTEREGDCDDSDPDSYSGAPEVWYDGIDEDCAGDVADDYDADSDGTDYPDDCDDEDADVNPDADEIWYDGVDQDCDGASDYDSDSDGHDDIAFSGDDCDDGDATVNPDVEETWYDGVDQDCAGDNDYDADGDGFAIDSSLGGSDCDDTDGSVSPDADEVYYDGVDQDCSGDTESDYDADGDGFDAIAWGGDDCEDTEPLAYPGASGEVCYDGVDTNCDGADDNDCDGDGYTSDAYGGDDCDDADVAINPAAADVLGDGIDTNCDGAAEYDYDGDGYDGLADGGEDCDDTDATISPDATDTCYDGVDQDCDGWSDYDCDQDGYDSDLWGGDDCDDAIGGVNPGVIDYPYDGIDSDCDAGSEYDTDGDGYLASWYGGDDCDDLDATVNPTATDACYDGVDANCDGSDDDDCDGDGWAAAEAGGLDCDDGDAAISPDATEIDGDGIDQDCDGADGADTSCTDCDGDGYDDGADCDDTDATVYPGAPDLWYDGIDADCGEDNDFDADADGADAIAWGGGDCNDADPATSPLVATDACGGGDEDCDGTVDEDCDFGDDTAADDTGTTSDDTGTADDTAAETRDTAVDWRPDSLELAAPDILERGTRCGCATPSGTPATSAVLALGALALIRRRRR